MTAQVNCISSADLNNNHDNITNIEPNFSDPEDFIDEDIDSEPLIIEILKSAPKLEKDFTNVVIVDNVPQVGSDRIEKLKTALNSILSKFGKISQTLYPIDANGKTCGYIFIQFENEQSATNARKQLDGHKLDKSHQFAVNTLKEFDQFTNISDEWKKPKLLEYINCPTLLNWTMTEDAIDQFSIVNNGGKRSNHSCSVYLNTLPQGKCIVSRQAWTEKLFAWSPLGVFLASFHDKGIVIWGGDEFERLAKIAHYNVSGISFSPCERFVITSAWAADRSQNRLANIFVSDISVSTVRRMFTQEVERNVDVTDDSGNGNIVVIGGDDSPSWTTNQAPVVFKWSFDGQYFARISSQDNISVYNTSNFSLIDRKSIKIPSIHNFEWAPSKYHYLAFYQCERNETPARLSVISIPDKVEVRGNNLFNVAGCKIFWQNRSNFVCFQLDRYIKQKIKEDADKPKYMNIYHNFEIFHMKERNCPIDTMELKSRCLHFSWEPNGNRFVIIHDILPGKTKVNFYRVSLSGIEEVKEFNMEVNHAEWSPMGSFVVLTSFRGRVSHRLYFIDTTDLSVMVEEEHHMMSSVSWDPSGRYLVSCSYASSQATDAGYIIWSFQGRRLAYIRSNELSQFLWRPRHASLLSEQKLKEIRKNFKQYGAKFKLQDDLSASVLSAEQLDVRQNMASEFLIFKQTSLERLQQQSAIKLALRKGSSNKPARYEEEAFDFLLSIDAEIIHI